MSHVELLRFVKIFHQRTGGAHGKGSALHVYLGELLHIKLLAYPKRAVTELVVLAAHFEHAVKPFCRKLGDALCIGGGLVHDDLSRLKPAKLVEDMVYRIGLIACNAKFARGDIAEGNAALTLLGLVIHRAQVVALALLEHGGIGDRAGGDDADNAALNEPLCGCGVLYLLADGDLIALCDELADIRLRAVVRHAAHGGAQRGVGHGAVTGRQRKVKLL